jgi:lipopolysaccharide assembly protein A
MAILMLLLGMVSAIVIVVFALQNGRVVTVSFFDWSVEASLVLVIMITALMGFLTALFFELFVQIKLRFRLYKMGRQVKTLEDELLKLQSMQNLPKVESQSAKDPLSADENAATKPGLGVQ